MRDETAAQNDEHMTDNVTNQESVAEDSLNDLYVPVEPYLENRIQEFGPNGEENFVQSISIGEKLLERARKIDYKFVIDQNKGEDEGPKQHPWAEVIKNLKKSHTEMCVLSDLMAMLQQRQYLMLDPVQQPPPNFSTAQVVVARKLGLRAAAKILQLGVENMQKSDVGKFHKALASLNSRFKMRKQGSYILGDATYKSCGSRKYFSDEGLFEVVRNDDPLAYPLKVELDPSIQMLSFISISSSDDGQGKDFPIPAFWRRIPFPHTQILGALYSIFVKEMFYLLSLECTQFRQIVCKTMGNLITVRLADGRKIYIRKHVAPPLTEKQVMESKTSALNVEELCLHLHLHKLHKLSHEEDMEVGRYHTYTMMLGIVNNKPRQPSLLNFEIAHAQHKIKSMQILKKLDDLAMSVREPNITVRLGPCSTSQESSINVILVPISKIIPTTKVSLRVTIGLTAIGTKSTYQIESSHRGSAYNGPDSDIAIEAVKREVRSQIVLMLRSTCTHNSWSILSTEMQDKHIFAQCPNKSQNLTITVHHDFSVSCLFNSTELMLDKLPGQNMVHKLSLLLNVICEPLKVSRSI